MRPHWTVIFLLLTAIVCAAQTAPPKPAPTPEEQWVQNHPALLAEFGQLYQRLQTEVVLPGPRTSSRLLPLLPASTSMYAALPNYGESAAQALAIFHQELQRSPVLREWWTRADMAENGPKIEKAVSQFSQIAQFLGDEIVVSASPDKPVPNPLLVAEIKKSGLKQALETMLASTPAKSRPDVRVVELRDLSSLPEKSPGQQMLVLVRPDYLIVGPDAAAVRTFSASLDQRSGDFASTPFAQRIAQAYRDNITVVAGLDLQSLIRQAAAEQKQSAAMIDRTGFSDAKYAVWEHIRSGDHDLSQSELSFTGPRRGIAAWLGAPTQLGSLDFASPKAMFAMSLVLANPPQIYDDLQQLAGTANPNAAASAAQTQQALNIDFKQDFLSLLGGELTVELDTVTPAPAWKAVLRVTDPVHLQQTLTKLLGAMNLRSEPFTAGGVTYHKVSPARVTAPAPQQSAQMAYAFVDGYLLLASSPEAAIDAVRVHRSGQSLAKSQRFQASLPPGHPSGVSALWYQDSAAMAALRLQQMAGLPNSLAQLSAQQPPTVMAAYAEPSIIRGASTSSAMDASVIAIVAAIAIPNLMRARTAANDATAIGMMRSVISAQASYAKTYPDRGFAPSIETLGAGAGGASAEHAALLADVGTCGMDKWCEKSGFRFRIFPVCLQEQCPQYVIAATPVSAAPGGRNFCATSDGVVRFKVAPPLTAPVSVRECRTWTPLQ